MRITNEYMAEGLGTFILIFFGTGAITLNQCSPCNYPPLLIPLIFGITVSIIIILLGPISGAHINPAVTVGFLILRKICCKKAIFYMGFQILGAISASILVNIIFKSNNLSELGSTVPVCGICRAFVAETVLTALLFAIIVLGMTMKCGSKVNAVMIGIMVFIGAVLGGPISGGSMNPARSLGPALISGVCTCQWLYWTAPMIGASIVAMISRCLVLPVLARK